MITTPFPDINTGTSFTAWLRLPPGRWQRIATGSEAEVARRLQAAAELHQHADVCVLAAGVDPNERRTCRR